MPINFTDFTDPRLRAQNKYEGISELLPNILEGYKASRAPEMINADLALKNAQAQHYMAPKEYAMSDFSKILQERANLSQQNPNDPRLALYDQLIQRKAEGTPGFELSVGPNGEVTVSQGNRSAGSKGGPQVVKDQNGNDVLVTPQSAAAQDRQQKRATAKAELHKLETVSQPYIGSGSIKRLHNDIKTYKSTNDPKIKQELSEKLVNAALADILTPELAILNTLVTSKENVTETDIKHQRNVLTKGWPESLHFELDNLPEELYPMFNQRYKQIQQELGDIANNVYATGAPIKLGQQEQSQSQQQMPQNSEQLLSQMLQSKPDSNESFQANQPSFANEQQMQKSVSQMTRAERDAEIARILEKRNGR